MKGILVFWIILGKTLYWKNEKFEANLCYNKAIEINRGDSNYWNWKGSICLVFLGTALFDLNRFDEAVKCYKEALNIQPNDAYTKSKLRAALNAL